MDEQYEKEYMQQHDLQVTRDIHSALRMTFLIGPILYVCTFFLHLFRLSTRTCIFWTLYLIGCWILIEILLNKGQNAAAKYVQLFYTELMIATASANPNFGIYLTYFAIPLLSCVYMDFKITRRMCIIGYVCMAGFLYQRAIFLVESGLTIDSTPTGYYFPTLAGYTLEYIVMSTFAIVMVRHGREVRQHYFESQREKLIAEASDHAKTSFLANMSHEIRTPINAVLGMNEMILRESRERKIWRYAENIKTASKSLLSLINDILDISKVESGKMELVETSYQVSSLLNDMVNMVQSRADEKGLELKVDIDEQIPCELYGDETRIRQVITNLLTNAVKYTKEGSVTLKIRCTHMPEPSFVRLDVAVVDTGIGVKKEDQARLFEIFRRVDEENNRGIEGTGLGLPLSKHLLELMGSRLMLESEYGKGSSFFFGLVQKVVDDSPIGDYKEMYERSLRDQSHYRESFQAPDAKILVVDDTRMNLEVCRGLLKKTQVQIDTADSGMECLNLIVKNKYDMILLDHKMPQMDGIECLQRMHETDGNCNETTPVIALTANAVSGAKEYYLEQGFDDYLSKPIQGDRLEQLLCQYLPPQYLKIPEQEDGEYIEELCIPPIEGIVGEDGLRYAGGDQEEYLNTLKLYQGEYEKKRTELIRFYEDSDLENYQISVHALKSTSRLIGANELSDLALALEEASKAGNIYLVRKEHPGLIEHYAQLHEAIAEVLDSMGMQKAGAQLEPMSREELQEFCEKLQSGLDEFDIGLLRRYVTLLQSKDLLWSVKEDLQEAVDSFDYDKLQEQVTLLKGYLSEPFDADDKKEEKL